MKSSNPISSEPTSEPWKTVEILFLVNLLVNLGKIWKVSPSEPMFTYLHVRGIVHLDTKPTKFAIICFLTEVRFFEPWKSATFH